MFTFTFKTGARFLIGGKHWLENRTAQMPKIMSTGTPFKTQKKETKQ